MEIEQLFDPAVFVPIAAIFCPQLSAPSTSELSTMKPQELFNGARVVVGVNKSVPHELSVFARDETGALVLKTHLKLRVYLTAVDCQADDDDQLAALLGVFRVAAGSSF